MHLDILYDGEETLPANNPISRETLPCPRPPVRWDGDEIPVTPKSIPVIRIFVNWAFQSLRPVCNPSFGLGLHDRSNFARRKPVMVASMEIAGWAGDKCLHVTCA